MVCLTRTSDVEESVIALPIKNRCLPGRLDQNEGGNYTQLPLPKEVKTSAIVVPSEFSRGRK